MGNAASSALRTDSASNGLAYGSLEAMGGGARKFKKKPVLVLDPEELAQAHAMFHEASAELLGEDVERAPRPAAILGLAPMDLDDEPEDFDQSDEAEAEDEADLPSPEAVLALTRRKTPPLPMDDYGSVEPLDNPDAAQPMMDDLPAIDRIEDGLDMATRIFPSLSLRPVDEEEDNFDDGESFVDEAITPELPATNFEPEPETPSAPDPEPKAETAPEPQLFREQPQPEEAKPIAPQPPAAEQSQAPVPAAKLPERTAPREEFTFTPAPPSPPVAAPAPMPLPEAATTVEREAAAEHIPASAHIPAKPHEPAREPVPAKPAPIASETGKQPARFDELNPAKDYETPEEVYDLDSWLSDAPEDGLPATNAEPEPEPVAEQGELSVPEDNSEVTHTGDDVVDGYAFMRDPRSRRSAVVALPPGKQSALRAKLLREAEEDAARAQRKEASGSAVLAFWAWLKGLFSTKN